MQRSHVMRAILSAGLLFSSLSCGTEEAKNGSAISEAGRCISEFGQLVNSVSQAELEKARAVVVQCELRNAPCDMNAFVSAEAARCVAQSRGLEEGIAPWTVDLAFNHGLSTPVWAVSNTLVDRGPTVGVEGKGMLVDAVSADVLGEFGWSATP